jgi:hypothetical protein
MEARGMTGRNDDTLEETSRDHRVPTQMRVGGWERQVGIKKRRDSGTSCINRRENMYQLKEGSERNNIQVIPTFREEVVRGKSG